MIVRAGIVAALLVATGSMTFLRSGLVGYVQPDEKWLETMAPDKVQGIDFLPSSENPEQSYKMDPATYEALKPFGIVSRIYDSMGQRFDAVLIAGDNADSFHDQRACFTSQGWNILSDKEVTINVPGRGPQQAVELQLQGPQGRANALYTFRGPSGRLFSKFNDMWKDYFVSELTSGRIYGGEFFRFIDLNGSDDTTKLYAFAGDYLAQSLKLLEQGKQQRLASRS